MFSGLEAYTEYTFCQRIKETPTSYAGEISASVMERTDKSTPATPSAPEYKTVTASSVELRVDADDECEYQYSMDGIHWQSEPLFDGLDVATAYSFYRRVAAGAKSYASAASAALSVTTQKRKNNEMPSAPELLEKTATSVTLRRVADAEYKCGSGAWQKENVFRDLEPYTQYRFYLRYAETETDFASDAGPALAVTTDKAQANAPAAPLAKTVGCDSITLEPIENGEYSMDGLNWQSQPVFSGLSPDTEYTFYQRIAETAAFACSAASAPLHIKVSHTPAEPSIEKEKAASCVADGSYDEVIYCSVCHVELSRETKRVPALEHHYESVTTEPTCTEQGYTTYTCSRCQDSFTNDYVDALGHIGGTATCCSKAVCTRCHNAYGAFDETAHFGGTEVRNAVTATCTQSGYTGDTYCLGCGVKLESGTEIQQTGHTWGEWIPITAPTCVQKGVEKRVCTKDEAHVETREVNALGHDYIGTLTKPTCEEKGYTTYVCSRCQDSYTGDYTDALAHAWNEGEITIAPTCTQAGEKKYVCLNDTSHFYTEPVAATGHKASQSVQIENKVEATCTQSGSFEEVVYCAVCHTELSRVSQAIAALEHDYQSLVTAPTATRPGFTTYTCTRCSQSYADSYTSPTGKVGGFKCKARTAAAQSVTWNKVTGVSGYQVQISNAAGNKWATYTTLKAGVNAYTFKGLAAGSAYKFRVRFFVQAADGKNYFSPWAAITSPTLPAGTSISKLTPAKKAFTAQWTKNAGVTGYQIQYGVKANFAGAKALTVKNKNTVKASMKSLSTQKVYYVRIRTYKAIGGVNYFSTWSKTYKVKTK